MGSLPADRTSPTLLGRLRQNPTDEAAWAGFVTRYSGQIYTWCRRWELQDADAEDVTPEVLLRLAPSWCGHWLPPFTPPTNAA